MIFLSLLTTVVLGALSAQARVVTDFSECSDFFYDGQEPRGIDQNSKKICQTLNYGDHFFATLYSISNRIPVYSAYTFNNPKKSFDEEFYSEVSEERNSKRPPQWFIEPQLSGHNLPNMMKENDLGYPGSIKRNQAVSVDYSKSGFDRGHLNPNAFQSADGRTATFTLTNAVPMDPCFNRVIWRAWETDLRKLLSNLPTQLIATAYLVTGAVPSQNYQIPQGAQINEEDARRVNVPTYVWTALCCKCTDESESFSLGFIGQNKPDGVVTLMTVEDLNAVLYVLYDSHSSIQIFKDNCFSNNKKSEEFRKKLSTDIEVPQKERLNMHLNSLKESISTTRKSQGSTRKRKISQYNNDMSYFQQYEKVKILTGNVCMITKVVQPNRFDIKSELRKRDLEQGPQTIECELVPEKSNPGVNIAADGTHCSSELRYCETKDGFKPCCTTPCLYEDTYKVYRCQSGQNSIECSPQYSRVTAKGKKCKDDHPCATYGYNYYWCWTDDGSWDYCSPPLAGTKTKKGQPCRINHACSTYGEDYHWCYTDYNNNWDYC